jgi:hypothetical protein
LKHLLLNAASLVLLLLPFHSTFAQETLTYERNSPPTMQMLIDAREVFEYEVRYGFLTLGWVDVELLPDTLINGEKAYHMRTRIRSNNRILFVGTRLLIMRIYFRLMKNGLTATYFGVMMYMMKSTRAQKLFSTGNKILFIFMKKMNSWNRSN